MLNPPENTATREQNDLRVLAVAPTGRDGPLICNLLASKGIECVNFPTAEAARLEMHAGAGAVILVEESLSLHDIAEWTAQIAEQPSWSDFPLIVLTVVGEVNRVCQIKALFRQP